MPRSVRFFAEVGGVRNRSLHLRDRLAAPAAMPSLAEYTAALLRGIPPSPPQEAPFSRRMSPR
jgi:hypothetical protein